MFRHAAIAALLATVPIADGVAAWLLRGNPAFHDTISPSWAEPAFLGVCLGLLISGYRRADDTTDGSPAATFYGAAAAAALAVPLLEFLREWGS